MTTVGVSTLHLPWILAVLVALVAGMGDLRNRRIPNRLTVPAFALGLAVNAWLGGWHGLLSGLEGAGLGLAILLPLVLLRGLGAGDWKLMGALGAFVGPGETLIILFVSVCMAAAWGVVEMFRRRRVKSTLRNLWELLQSFFFFGLRPNPDISIDSTPLIKLPFGAVAAVATAFALSVAWLRR